MRDSNLINSASDIKWKLKSIFLEKKVSVLNLACNDYKPKITFHINFSCIFPFFHMRFFPTQSLEFTAYYEATECFDRS